MTMSRAELAAELWGRLQVPFTDAGIVNADSSGNLKEPVDSALMKLGITYSDLSATGDVVTDANVPAAIAWAVHFGYAALLRSLAHTGTSVSMSVGAPSVSKTENKGDYIRSLERLRDQAKTEAESLTTGATWVFGSISTDIIATIEETDG